MFRILSFHQIWAAALFFVFCGFSINIDAQQLTSNFVRPLSGEAWIPMYRFGIYDDAGSDPFCGIHLGDDIQRPAGTNVYAIADGTVTRSTDHPGLGHSVHIQHSLSSGDITSVYYHLKREAEGGKQLNLGQPVTRGEVIGVITDKEYDNFGIQHLHFGIRSASFRKDDEYDNRTHKWFYPGYSSIWLLDQNCACDSIAECYKNKCYSLKQCKQIGIDQDKADPVHAEISAEWMNPKEFIGHQPDPLTPAQVSTKFSIGDQVVVTQDGVNVRNAPYGTLVGNQFTKFIGKIISDSLYSTPSYGHPYWWWKVDFESDPDGWVAEDYLDVNYCGTANNGTSLDFPPLVDLCTSGATPGNEHNTDTGFAWRCTSTTTSVYSDCSATREAKFVIGDRVETTSDVPGVSVLVFDTPEGTGGGTQELGAQGAVAGGPRYAEALGFWVWNVNFDTGQDGWVREEFLRKVDVNYCGTANGGTSRNPPSLNLCVSGATATWVNQTPECDGTFEWTCTLGSVTSACSSTRGCGGAQ